MGVETNTRPHVQSRLQGINASLSRKSEGAPAPPPPSIRAGSAVSQLGPRRFHRASLPPRPRSRSNRESCQTCSVPRFASSSFDSLQGKAFSFAPSIVIGSRPESSGLRPCFDFRPWVLFMMSSKCALYQCAPTRSSADSASTSHRIKRVPGRNSWTRETSSFRRACSQQRRMHSSSYSDRKRYALIT
jgi:hypothetical protein